MQTYSLSVLEELEAESIHLLREVAGELEHAAMVVSAGKDSLVLLRLAQKAFAPGPVPFALLRADTPDWEALAQGKYGALIGSARREDEHSRAKLWGLFNGRLQPGEAIRVFPLSRWTELDVLRYLEAERIPGEGDR